MTQRRRKSWPVLMEAGQCPVCGWWFDGYHVGENEPTGNTAPIVEWSVDAKETGKCLRHECYVANLFREPDLVAARATAIRHRAHRGHRDDETPTSLHRSKHSANMSTAGM